MVTPPIIVALDLGSAGEAVEMARSLEGRVAGFKVGLGLLHGPGPALVGALARVGPVFADAKLHDIPSQVESAARRLGEYGARWVTAHASGGAAMLEAAVRGLAEGTGGSGGILAVTVLTSLAEADTAAAFGRSPGELTSRLARLAGAAGTEGLVCSPKELGVVASVAPELVKVTPGVRPEGTAGGDDQARVATPADAIARGADYLVIGRPITRAADPVAAAESIAESLTTPRSREGDK
ncbi:MAG TPA: orotidine-5'-phosphate decarboxylase [Acidimicrobiia bacterium]|nr:orotidine-5'-phosphate decarboxylase [Acidimicrobiia bacterium]